MAEGKKIRSVYTGGTGEIVEKKSRFIATICPVSSEAEAQEFINGLKKQYWDARHNCSAYVLGERQEISHCSDDGEPSGTAGRPMLDVLLREGITNVCAVVTRYFGGVLLGTGGLVRAYQESLQEGLKNCVLMEKKTGFPLTVTMDYNSIGKLQYLFAQEELVTLDSQYGADVTTKLLVPSEKKETIQTKIDEATSATAKQEWGDMLLYACLPDQPNGIKIFEEEA